MTIYIYIFYDNKQMLLLVIKLKMIGNHNSLLWQELS